MFLNCSHRRLEVLARVSQAPRYTDVRYVKISFPTRRELYVHKNIEHGQTGHGKSVIPPNITDQKLQNVFKANTKFIFEDNAEDDVQSTINIPLQNDVSIQEIVNQTEQIFNKQQTAFKIVFFWLHPSAHRNRRI